VTIGRRSLGKVFFGFAALFVVLLPLYPSYRGSFVVGLGLFLVAHLLYIVAFATRSGLHRSKIRAVVVILLYSAILAYILFPHLGEMVIPVSVYLIVITGMGMLAALRRMDGRGLLYGALAFLLSESLIAIDRFLAPVPAASCATIITYYSVQHAITHSFLEEARGFG